MSRTSWCCPFCQQHATIQERVDTEQARVNLDIQNAEGPHALVVLFTVCPNESCKRFSLEAVLYKLDATWDTPDGYALGPAIFHRNLVPASTAKPFPDYVPWAIRSDYDEACLIRDLSPKAAATLARRALQGAIRDYWQVKPGKLVDEIAQIKDKVTLEVWESIESVRKVGNIGAHMEDDISVIVDVEPNEAEALIGLVEMFLEDWYVARHERQQKLAKTKELAANKEAQRKARPAP